MKSRSFESFLAPPDERGCMLWTGVTIRSNGTDLLYGRITRNGKKHLAHRWAYEQANGPIPDGMNVLHTCDVGLCCTQGHLYLGDQIQNMADCKARGRMYRPGAPPVYNEEHAGTRVTDEQIAQLMARRAKGETTVALGREYGINSGTVSRLARGLGRVKHPHASG